MKSDEHASFPSLHIAWDLTRGDGMSNDLLVLGIRNIRRPYDSIFQRLSSVLVSHNALNSGVDLKCLSFTLRLISKKESVFRPAT